MTEDLQLTSTQVVGVFNGIGETSRLDKPAQWLVDWVRDGDNNDTGVTVTPKRALGLPSIYFCINKIANDVSQLPLPTYKKQEGKAKEIATKLPSYYVLEQVPNEMMTPAVFRKTIQANALIYGNGRAAIVRNGRGEPSELIPLPPDYTFTVVVYEDENYLRGEKWHVIRWPDGSTPTKILDENVLHIMSLSMDGIAGYGLVDIARNAVGEGLAGQKFTNRNFQNQGVPPMVLEAPAGVFRKKEEAEEFLRNWNQYHSGLNNSGKVGLLREGIKATTLGMKPHDAQVLEQRKFSRQEIMLLFGIESMPGDEDSVSYNSLEQKNRAYLTHCLGPWMRQWEQECERKLLTNQQRLMQTHYIRFDAYDLVRPDAVAEADMITKLRTASLITGNEGRDWLDLPPIAGQDDLFNPAITTSQPAPKPPPSKTEGNAEEDNEQGDDSKSATKDFARRSLVSSIRRLVKVEANRVKDAALKAKNFTLSIEAFYVRWKVSFAAELCEIGGETWHAEEHADTSLKRLVGITEVNSTDTLLAAVEVEIATWPARADALAETILKLEGLVQ